MASSLRSAAAMAPYDVVESAEAAPADGGATASTDGLVLPPRAGAAAVAATASGSPPWSPQAQWGPAPGYTAVSVWYAPIISWRQKIVYVSPHASSDHLKWFMADLVGNNVTTFRVHSGWRGTPYDRMTPVTQPPPGAHADEQPTVLLLVPSFGP
jgi:hypothetical protein